MVKRRILTGVGIISAAFMLLLQPLPGSAASPTAADGKKASVTSPKTAKSPSQAKKTAGNPAKRKDIKRVASKGDGRNQGEIYLVKRGDTLAKISRLTGVPIGELREINSLKGSSLKVGQRLLIKKQAGKNSEEIGPLKMAAGLELEEEEDGGASDENSWAEIERQKRENDALLGKWTTPDEPKLLVKVAMAFLGTPYRFGGSSVKGIDCSAFVKKIYSLFGIDLPRTAYEQSHVGMPVSRSQLSEGDLIFFHTRRAVGHVGIYIGGNKFVHASSRNRGVRVDDLDEPYYKKRFVGAVRLKGVDDGA